MNGFASLIKDERGAALTEYALIMALLAVATIGALTTLGNGIQTGLTNLANTLTKLP